MAGRLLSELAGLLTDLPLDAHAILTTRHDLRLGLHQLRLAGELAEIRAADLRFSGDETRELLDASGITLSEAGAALLHQRTEGWAAGLRLAAISLAGHPGGARGHGRAAHRVRAVLPARRILAAAVRRAGVGRQAAHRDPDGDRPILAAAARGG